MAEHRPFSVPNPTPLSRWAPLALWGAFLCLAAFYLLYVTPRRGVLFSDEAWYLYNAVRALHHGEIGSYLPQAPAHLFNAFFMLFLGDGYLPQRYAFILCNLAAALVLLAGVGGGNPDFRRSLPLGLGCVLVAGLSSVINYQNGPGLFLSLGLGLFFLGDRAAGVARTAASPKAWTLSVAAGFFLAASVMTNLTVAPGLALICLGLLWRAWRTKSSFRAVCPLACGLFLALMLGAYAASLGLDRLFHVPKGHAFLYGRLGEIVLLAVAWPVLWGIWVGVAAFFGSRGRRTDPVRWGLWLLVSAAAALLAKSLIVAAGGRAAFPLDLLPTLNPVILLPHFAYALLCLGLLRGGGQGEAAKAVWTRALLATLAMLLYWAQQTFYSEIFVTFSMIFLSGFMMALGLLLLSLPAPRRSARGMAGASVLAALVFVAGSLGYLETGGWTGETRLSGKKAAMDNHRLRGLLESPERAGMLAAIERAYVEAGCRDKALLAFNNASLLHYVLDHPAPPGLSYIPQPIYFESEIRAVLEGNKPWCVLYSASYRRPGTAEREEAFMRYLASRAAERRVLGEGSPGHPYTDFVLFTGPAPSDSPVAARPGPEQGPALGDPRRPRDEPALP